MWPWASIDATQMLVTPLEAMLDADRKFASREHSPSSTQPSRANLGRERALQEDLERAAPMQIAACMKPKTVCSMLVDLIGFPDRSAFRRNCST